MAAKCFIDGAFFAPVWSLCLKLIFISLSILCFSIFFMFHIIFAIMWNSFYNL